LYGTFTESDSPQSAQLLVEVTYNWFVSDIAVFVLKMDVKLQPANHVTGT